MPICTQRRNAYTDHLTHSESTRQTRHSAFMAITVQDWYLLGGRVSDLQGKWLVHGSMLAMPCQPHRCFRFNEGFCFLPSPKMSMRHRMRMRYDTFVFYFYLWFGELNLWCVHAACGGGSGIWACCGVHENSRTQHRLIHVTRVSANRRTQLMRNTHE